MKSYICLNRAAILFLISSSYRTEAQDHPQYEPCVNALNDPQGTGGDTLFISEFQTYALTMATTEVLRRGDVGLLDTAKLKATMIDDQNYYKFDYWQRLPPYNAVPNPVLNIFYKYACDNNIDTTATIVSFCQDPAASTGPAPDSLAIPLVTLSINQRDRAIKRICTRFSSNWDNLVGNVQAYYTSQGLVGTKSKPDDIAKPLATESPQSSNNSTMAGGTKKKTSSGTLTGLNLEEKLKKNVANSTTEEDNSTPRKDNTGSSGTKRDDIHSNSTNVADSTNSNSNNVADSTSNGVETTEIDDVSNNKDPLIEQEEETGLPDHPLVTSNAEDKLAQDVKHDFEDTKDTNENSDMSVKEDDKGEPFSSSQMPTSSQAETNALNDNGFNFFGSLSKGAFIGVISGIAVTSLVLLLLCSCLFRRVCCSKKANDVDSKMSKRNLEIQQYEDEDTAERSIEEEFDLGRNAENPQNGKDVWIEPITRMRTNDSLVSNREAIEMQFHSFDSNHSMSMKFRNPNAPRPIRIDQHGFPLDKLPEDDEEESQD